MFAPGPHGYSVDRPIASPGPRVIVVNANAAARARICSLLEAAGFATTACDTAAAALVELRNNPPLPALVVDFMLDDMSGFGLVQASRTEGMHPITIMTAERGEVSAAVRAVREGLADFLPGPPDARLVQSLRTALRHAGGKGRGGVEFSC
ncbi:MAG: response regulator [Gammaproteobacteria bacterium]